MPTPTPSLPSPRTWATDDLITTPRLRADVANAVAFLAQKPVFVGQNITGASIPSNADTPLGLQTELVDNWNGHVTANSGSATPNQYFAPVAGWYLCRCTLAFAATVAGAYPLAAEFAWTTGGVAAGPFKGAAVIGGSSLVYSAQAVDLIEQTASGAVGGSGDYIQPNVWQNSGGAVAMDSGAAAVPEVSVRWVCATSGAQPLPVPPLTAVPSPITSAWMNANVRDAIRFLAYPPVCKAIYTAGSATLPSNALGTAAVIDLTTVVVDNYGGFTTGAAAKYTAPVAGIYFVYGQFNLTTSATAAVYAAGLSVNGGTTQFGDIVTFAPSSGTGGGASVAKRLRLSAGDTVQLMGVQSSGAALAYAAAAETQTRFIAVWEGV